MNIRNLLITTIISTGLIITPAVYAADNITTGTVNTATSPISKEAVADPRVAALSFVEHVNYARVALAMKNADLAKQHVSQARNMIIAIKSATTGENRITDIGSGRIIYTYETEYKYHYFPIQTGPVQIKQMSSGPIWAKNDLAVTDADIVYLSLDVSGDKADTYLNSAEAAITAGDLKEAGNSLAKLTEAVVVVDSKIAVPQDKARDNIALASNFVAGKNYEAARYALKHADEALNEMQLSDDYKKHRVEIIAMRKDVGFLQSYIDKKDPTMIEKSEANLDKWWKELKAWSKSDK